MNAKQPYTCHERGDTRIRWRIRDDGLEESVQFAPGFICRDHSMRGHGNHGMEICWYLRGPDGGAQFKLYTDWVPGRPALKKIADMFPMGADVGYHSRRPRYEDQEPIDEDCAIIGGICYYDGSGSRAFDLVEIFKTSGEPAIWDELEEIYRQLGEE